MTRALDIRMCAHCGDSFEVAVRPGPKPSRCPAHQPPRRPTTVAERQAIAAQRDTRMCARCGDLFEPEVHPGPPPSYCPKHQPSARQVKCCKWCGDELPVLRVAGKPPDYCEVPRKCRRFAITRRKREQYRARLNAGATP